MLKHLHWDRTTGNDILIVLSAIQLVLGLCEPIFEDVNTDVSYVGKSWLLQLQGRLCAMKGQMWVEHQWSPYLQRFHNQSLMKEFSNIDGITIGKLDRANHCRMYIKCITISDLAHVSGVHIPGNRMNGKCCAPSTLIWPQLPRPPPKYCQVFRWCIRQVFSSIRQPGRLNSLTGK